MQYTMISGTDIVSYIINISSTTAILSLSLHDALPISMAALMGTLPIALGWGAGAASRRGLGLAVVGGLMVSQVVTLRSEEHTSELQSRQYLVCRLLREKKKECCTRGVCYFPEAGHIYS